VETPECEAINGTLPPVRIVHYLKWIRLRDGGVVRAVLDMCQALSARGHEVTLLTTDDTDVPPAWKSGTPGQPRCVRLTLRDPLAAIFGGSANGASRDQIGQMLDRASISRASEVLRSTDVLHVHGPWTTSNIQLTRLARRLKVPYVASPHGMLDDWCMAQGTLKKNLHLALLSGPMLRHARAVHCTSQGELRQTIARSRNPRTIVVPLPFDASSYLNGPGPQIAQARFSSLRSPLPKVLFLGRLHEIKRVDLLMKAAAVLRDRGTPIQLVLAGPADPPEYIHTLKALATELALGETCDFVGMVGGDEKISLYQACNVFVLASVHENFGFVIIEAMACGVPAVASRGVAIWPELEASGGAAIFNGDEHALADAIGGIISDPARAAAMGAAARTLAMQFADPARIIEQHERMYEGLP
jgi:glycosyltransferase involved in cell wall biosynthesis